MNISFENISAIYWDWLYSLGTRSAVKILKVFTTKQYVLPPSKRVFVLFYLELFLRPGSKLELHCRISLGRAGPDDHFRWAPTSYVNFPHIPSPVQENGSVALVPGPAPDWSRRWAGKGGSHSSHPWLRSTGGSCFVFSCSEQPHSRWPCPLLGWLGTADKQILHNTTE